MTTTTEPGQDTAADPGAVTIPLSTRMREASHGEHGGDDDGRSFGSQLIAGELPIDAHAVATVQTYLVYAVMEEAAEVQRQDPVGSAFYFPELLRVPSLERDLEYLLGPRWRDETEALPATQRYQERIRALCFDSPSMFMAHQYTRYLGDLSGGQIIRRTLANAYGLAKDGIRFYIFEDIPQPKRFKELYRTRVDAAPWDDAEQARILEEIKIAFQLNNEMFEDLGRAYEQSSRASGASPATDAD